MCVCVCVRVCVCPHSVCPHLGDVVWPVAREEDGSTCGVEGQAHVRVARGINSGVPVAAIQFQHIHTPLSIRLWEKESGGRMEASTLDLL